MNNMIGLQLLSSIGAFALALACPRWLKDNVSRRPVFETTTGLLFVALPWGATWLSGSSDLHFFFALTLVCWLMTLLALLSPLRERTRALLGISCGLCAAAVAMALCAQWLGVQTPAKNESWQINLHAAVALLAYSVLSLCGLTAALLLFAERRMRGQRSASLPSWMPAISGLESVLFQLLAGGFAFLTLTVLSGVLFIHNWFAQHLVHKTVLTLLAWLCFLVLLIGHYRKGWRGARAARWTLAACFLLLLAFFGSKLVLELVLHRTV
jgi:ABC-type uncharacterized transport system permease subunit